MESGLVLTEDPSRHTGKNMQNFYFLKTEVKIAELGNFYIKNV